jgi:hypothetical protein
MIEIGRGRAIGGKDLPGEVGGNGCSSAEFCNDVSGRRPTAPSRQPLPAGYSGVRFVARHQCPQSIQAGRHIQGKGGTAQKNLAPLRGLSAEKSYCCLRAGAARAIESRTANGLRTTNGSPASREKTLETGALATTPSTAGRTAPLQGFACLSRARRPACSWAHTPAVYRGRTASCG